MSRDSAGPPFTKTLCDLDYYGRLMPTTESVQLVLEQLNTPLDQQVGRYRELLGKEEELYKKFKEEQLQTYKTLLPVVQKQRRAISKHIRALANG